MISSSGVAMLPGGGRLSFSVYGPATSEPPILLNRPLGGSVVLWGEFATTLAASLRVIVFDPQGAGESSDPRWLHSTQAMAEDALVLLNTLGVEAAHVFGLSLGARVASWIALASPERVKRLILASMPPLPHALSLHALRQLLDLARSLALDGSRAEVAMVHEILSPEFRNGHPARVREIEELVLAAPSKKRNVLVLAFAAARSCGQSELQQIGAKTLLLFGDRDPFVGRTSRSHLLCNIPNAELEIFEQCGHDLSLEKPRELAARILRFLRE